MRRLTVDKVCGYALPKTERIDKGNTSIIYRTADPAVLEVFSIEQIKLEWWLRGLAIIEDYDEVAYAHYVGYKNGAYSSNYTSVDLPVYRCLVQRLNTPDREQMRRIRQVQKQIGSVHPAWGINGNIRDYTRRKWEMLADLEIPEIADSVAFVMDYDHENIYADYGAGDFMIMNNQIVPLDPFHHRDVHAGIELTDAPARR